MSTGPTEPLKPLPLVSPTPWNWFAMFLLAGVFALVGYATWTKQLSESNLALILGIMVGWITTKVNFDWGSSASSKIKDDTISRLA